MFEKTLCKILVLVLTRKKFAGSIIRKDDNEMRVYINNKSRLYIIHPNDGTIDKIDDINILQALIYKG